MITVTLSMLMVIGGIVTFCSAMMFAGWLMEQLCDSLLKRYQVADLFIKYAWHRHEFDQYLVDRTKGWKYAADIMEELIGCARLFLPDDNIRSNFYAAMIRHFQDYGCTDLDPYLLGEEDADPVFVKVYAELKQRESDDFEGDWDDSDYLEDYDH